TPSYSIAQDDWAGYLESGRNQGVSEWCGRQKCFGHPDLRQVWQRKRKSCQEKPGIVTGLVAKAEKLSRKARNRDRFGIENGKAVKKSSES
ncbi:hypothetical protein, partial [Bacillus sp. ISL-55]|uniref:hypothetical protein n=1 Tax=Bacillus sp. ISL-55 TaxID=2819134 RepID=UPI001BED3984